MTYHKFAGHWRMEDNGIDPVTLRPTLTDVPINNESNDVLRGCENAKPP